MKWPLYGKREDSSSKGKSVPSAPSGSPSPVYLIGFLIIMLAALILHFVPKQESGEQLVEPQVVPVSQSV